MDKRAIANQLVSDFGKMLTVDGLTLDADNNGCVLVFDDELVLNIEYDEPEERLVFSIFIDTLPKEGAEHLLRELMGANLYWHQTRGATLCLEEGTDGVILVYPRSVAILDYHSFEAVVENLLNQAEKWRGKIRAVTPSVMAKISDHPPLYG